MTTLDAIARPNGTFTMVAMDQRESLRHMFDVAGQGRPDDDVLIDFKVAVADQLGPLASGFLIDRQYGFDRVRATLPSSSGLILAADALEQEAGGPVEETDIDPVVADDALEGVVAIKLLLIWRRDARREQRVALAERFVRLAAERGVLSVLEPVVRPTSDEFDWDLDAAIREAARELSPLQADLYKAQVPSAGIGDESTRRTASAKLNDCMTGPWVVLSQGVERERFEPAVRAACQEGASGFLAGRALWSDVVGHADVPGQLRQRSLPRLRSLIETVDEVGRPWNTA